MKFTKKILPPGKYTVSRLDGTRGEEHIPLERLHKWAKSADKMLAAGVRIPAPWGHKTEVGGVTDPSKLNPKENAGWWEKLWVGNDGALYGTLDVPLDDDAKRVGTVVTEVSPLVRDFKDGLGRDWKDAPFHIALVTHPIAPDQENFVPTEQPTLALAMSQLLVADRPTVDQVKSVVMAVPEEDEDEPPMSRSVENSEPAAPKKTNASMSTIQDALEVLKEIGLTLPDDTTPENLIERIVVAGAAVSAATGAGEVTEPGMSNNNPSATPKEQPTPIVMGDVTLTTPTPGTADPKIMAFATKNARSDYGRRINSLIEKGVISLDYAKTELVPLVQGFQLSLDTEGNQQAGPLDKILVALERLPGGVSLTGAPHTAGRKDAKGAAKDAFQLSLHEEDLPRDFINSQDVTDEEADEIAKQQLRNAGKLVSVK